MRVGSPHVRSLSRPTTGKNSVNTSASFKDTKTDIQEATNQSLMITLSLFVVRLFNVHTLHSDFPQIKEKLFTHIKTFDNDGSQQPKRNFVVSSSLPTPSDFGHTGFQDVVPSFTLLKEGVNSSESHFWRDREAFCEVKCSKEDSPDSTKKRNNKNVLVQAAHYARLHMSASPFQLFSVGLLIYGDRFSVAFFDRGGVQVSPESNIWDDLTAFIRVVRSLTFHMSAIELGQDPTVTMLSPEEQTLVRKGILNDVLVDPFPTYRVTAGGSSNREWYTLGAPIWSSVSLFGRGTAIWKVFDPTTGKTLILKNYWRARERRPESEVYRSIKGDHPAVAKFEEGGDVRFPGEDRLISAAALRCPGNHEATRNDPTLHRLLLWTVGRPLWEAESEYEIMQGMRDALLGKSFFDVGCWD